MITQKPWFARKRYGWGRGLPLTWQGRLTFALFAAFNIWNFSRFDAVARSGTDMWYTATPGFVLSILVLVVICWLTGETPRRQWGDKKDTDTKQDD